MTDLPTGRACLGCGDGLRRIQLRPQGYEGAGTQEQPRQYSEWDAPRSWTGSRPLGGVLQHWMCPTCGLVQLYAIPADAPSELTPAEPPEAR